MPIQYYICLLVSDAFNENEYFSIIMKAIIITRNDIISALITILVTSFRNNWYWYIISDNDWFHLLVHH